MAGVFHFADHAISTGIDSLEDLFVIATGDLMAFELFQHESSVAIQIQGLECRWTARIAAWPWGLTTAQREHCGKENQYCNRCGIVHEKTLAVAIE